MFGLVKYSYVRRDVLEGETAVARWVARVVMAGAEDKYGGKAHSEQAKFKLGVTCKYLYSKLS